MPELPESTPPPTLPRRPLRERPHANPIAMAEVMDNVASKMQWDAVMADRREGGEWVLSASATSAEGSGVEAEIRWRRDDSGDSRSRGAVEVVTPSPVVFPSLASYTDFKAFWRGCGGRVEES